MRSCPEQLLSDLKDQQSPGRLWQECDPRKAGTRKKIPSSDLKIALEKRQRKLLLSPSSSPFFQELSLLSLSSYVNSDLFYYFFFPSEAKVIPFPLCLLGPSQPGCISTGTPKKPKKPQTWISVAQQFWEAPWRGAGAQKLHFFWA